MNNSNCDSFVSIIVPVYNEEKVIIECNHRIKSVMCDIGLNWEVIYINDGSQDNTLGILYQLRQEQANIAIIDFSRNFGKEVAMTAGLDFAKGDAVVVIDADLQDPPELIKAFVRYWHEGYDVVYGKRSSRRGESIVKKITSYLFYRVIQKVTKVQIPSDTGDFRLLSRRAVDALLQMREKNRFMKGLFSWVGYNTKAVLYERNSRFAGDTKWNYWRLWNFALDGLTSFTIAPLKIATYIGLLISVLSFFLALFFVYKTLMYGDPVKGYPSLMVIILFIGGVQLGCIGLIGEYLGRMFVESKQRPLYLLKEHLPSAIDENIAYKQEKQHG